MLAEPTTAIPVLSLFSGAGGLDYGFVKAGFLPVLAIDWDVAATRTFNANFAGNVARAGDLAGLSPAAVTRWLSRLSPPRGVIGGPPCQGFSYGNTKASPDDPRNELPFRYCELLAALNRRWSIDFFVFENVLGLRSPKHRDRLRDIIRRFSEAGFNVAQAELDAERFRVPQRRRRLFLVGINRDTFRGDSFEWPNGTEDLRTVRQAISGLPEPILRTPGLTADDIPYHANHWTMPPRSRRFADNDFNGSRSFRRLEWDQPSWTVAYGNREIHIHPDGKRRLSILEAMLLQGFPKKFVLQGNFSEQVQQVSNAVPPPVARAVATAIRKQLYTRQ
ncbi:MAG: DNA cytosine methyltransferase [Planctomycetota bacterium]|nr:DNA cytosine methyltransferase [Planctomycetota bacterium]